MTLFKFMIKKLLFFIPLSVIAQNTFSVGLSTYSGTWTTIQNTYPGTNINLITSLNSSLGPKAVFTFNYAQNTGVLNLLNPSFASYSLSAIQFIPPKGANFQALFNTNSTLANFGTITTTDFSNLYFTETTSNNIRLLNLPMNSTTGQFVSTTSQVFPYLSTGLSQIQAVNSQANNLAFNALTGPLRTGVNQIVNNTGNPFGFTNNLVYPAYPHASPQFLATSSSGNVGLIAFTQLNYQKYSLCYSRQVGVYVGEPFLLTDYTQSNFYFLQFGSTSNNLFFGEIGTNGTRIGACSVAAGGRILLPTYLSGSFTYSSGTLTQINYDLSNHAYVLFNGSSNSVSALYSAAYNTTLNRWSAISTATTTFYNPQALPQATPISSGLYLTQVTQPSTGYSILSCILNNTNYTFGTPTTVNQPSTATIGTITGTTAGSPTLLNISPTVVSTVDTNNNVVTVYNGNTSGGNYIFYNVYLTPLNSFFGEQAINTTSPQSISPPILTNFSNQIAVFWSENSSGTFSIFASLYSTTNKSFGTPTLLSTGFTTQPQIQIAPNSVGVVFAGTN